MSVPPTLFLSSSIRPQFRPIFEPPLPLWDVVNRCLLYKQNIYFSQKGNLSKHAKSIEQSKISGCRCSKTYSKMINLTCINASCVDTSCFDTSHFGSSCSKGVDGISGIRRLSKKRI